MKLPQQKEDNELNQQNKDIVIFSFTVGSISTFNLFAFASSCYLFHLSMWGHDIDTGRKEEAQAKRKATHIVLQEVTQKPVVS